MWHRTFRIVWWLLFIWAAVLGFRHGSLKWVIIPLFGMACLFIAQEYIAKHYPSFNGRLNVALVGLLLVYNIAFTLWPAFVTQLPWTAAALIGQKNRKDFRTAIDLDPGPLKAQQVLARYRAETEDAEAIAIGGGLGKLTEKRKMGTFGADDVKTEQELLARYQRLVQQSDELKRIITQNAPELPNTPPPSPAATGAPAPPAGIPPAPARDFGKGTAPKSSVPGGVAQSRVSPIPDRVGPSRAQELDALVNAVSPEVRTPIGVVVEVPGEVGTAIERELYAALKSVDSRVVPDVFQESKFKAKGFFDEIEAGNTADLVQTRVFGTLRYLLIGRLTHDCHKSAELDPDLVACTLSLTTKVFDQAGRLKSQIRSPQPVPALPKLLPSRKRPRSSPSPWLVSYSAR